MALHWMWRGCGGDVAAKIKLEHRYPVPLKIPSLNVIDRIVLLTCEPETRRAPLLPFPQTTVLRLLARNTTAS